MPARSSHANWQARIDRAERLSSQYEFAREILEFYARVASFQKSLHAHIASSTGQVSPGGFKAGARGAIELSVLLPHYREFLLLIEQVAPIALSDRAGALASLSLESWVDELEEYWRHGGIDDLPDGSFAQFLPRAFLQPYAEFCAGRTERALLETTVNLCPLCGARPLLGVLKPEGDGGKRFLLCSFCSHEWEFRRIYCAYCGEAREGSLPVFVAQKFPHIRVEACDTCRHCMRTVDLTKDGNAVPVVDDLAAIPLGLWAEEYGFQRIHENLFGT
jgi:formate dehydrogenase accessory protein FdhE